MRQSLAGENRLHRKRAQIEAFSITVHDLRNPASGILSAAESLLDELQGDEKHLVLLRAIESASREILRVIDELETSVKSKPRSAFFGATT
jgi:signal transduction histidine kinase